MINDVSKVLRDHGVGNGYRPGKSIPFYKTGITAKTTPVWEYIATGISSVQGVQANQNGDVIFKNADFNSGTFNHLYKVNGLTGNLLWSTTVSVGRGRFSVDSNGDIFALFDLSMSANGTTTLRKIDGKTGAVLWTIPISNPNGYSVDAFVLAGGGSNFLISLAGGANTFGKFYAKSNGMYVCDTPGVSSSDIAIISKSSGDLFNSGGPVWRRYSNVNGSEVESVSDTNINDVKFLLFGIVNDVPYYTKSSGNFGSNPKPVFTTCRANKERLSVENGALEFIYSDTGASTVYHTYNGKNIILAKVRDAVNGTDISVFDHQTGGIYGINTLRLGIPHNIVWFGPKNEIFTTISNNSPTGIKISKFTPFGIKIRNN